MPIRRPTTPVNTPTNGSRRGTARQLNHREGQKPAERHRVFVVRSPQAVQRLLPRPRLGEDLEIVLAKYGEK